MSRPIMGRRILAGAGAALYLSGAEGASSTRIPVPLGEDAALVALHQSLTALQDRESSVIVAMDEAQTRGDDAELARWEAEVASLYDAQHAVRLGMAETPAIGLAGVLVKALVLSDAATQGASQGTVEIADSLDADCACLVPWLSEGRGE
jgi:hypothetical protein